MLDEQATARTLGLARICAFGLCAAVAIARPAWKVGYLPTFRAVGVMRWLGAELWAPYLTLSMLVALQIVAVALSLAVAAGIGPYRRLSLAACAAVTVSEGLVSRPGAMTHVTLLPLFTAFILCFFLAADALTLVRQRQLPRSYRAMYRAPLVAASLVFALTYSLVAIRRLVVGGPDIFLDDTILVCVALQDARFGGDGGLGIQACESVAMVWALRIGFPVVTLFELLSPLVVFSRRFRWTWIAVMVPFHIGTGLLMGIWFTYNLALMPLLVAGFDPFARRESGRRHDTQPDGALPELLPRAA